MADAVRIDYAVPIVPRSEWHWVLITCPGLFFTSSHLWFGGVGNRFFAIFGLMVIGAVCWAIFCSRRSTRKILIEKDAIRIKGLWNRTERTIRKDQIEKVTHSLDGQWIWFEKYGMTNCQSFGRGDFSEESWNILTYELDRIEAGSQRIL